MPGLVPGIHVFFLFSLRSYFLYKAKTWMAGTKPGHDEKQSIPPPL
jgi:hypothetical protein